jgi:hypothetical protein
VTELTGEIQNGDRRMTEMTGGFFVNNVSGLKLINFYRCSVGGYNVLI